MFKTFSAISAPVALSVSAVNRQVKQLLESDPILEDLSVEGEISNLSRPASGHIYFTLKDVNYSRVRAAFVRESSQTTNAEIMKIIGNPRMGKSNGRTRHHRVLR